MLPPGILTTAAKEMVASWQSTITGLLDLRDRHAEIIEGRLVVSPVLEFMFTEVGLALTRVSVVHSGWEKLSDEQLAKDCALPGGYLSGAFDKGWATILGRLASAAEEAGR